MAYNKTIWVDNNEPFINAENLNKIENGIANAIETDSVARVSNVVSKNLFNKNNSIIGSLWQGNIQTSTSSMVSSYIPVKAGQQYTFSYEYDNLAHTVWRNYTFYNTSKTYINAVDYDPTIKKYIVNPTSDGFIRVVYDKNCYNIQVEEGTTTTAYTPYLNLEEAMQSNVYSDGEVVIGKWLGQPLYRKIIKIPKSSLASGTGADYNFTISNIKELVNVNGYVLRTDNEKMLFPQNNTDTTYSIILNYFNENLLRITTGANIYSLINTIYVTLEYTKTTD